jgi:menaquinone-dependent protoporphyrinogen oxidase
LWVKSKTAVLSGNGLSERFITFAWFSVFGVVLKALIVYGTRYGATAAASDEIGKILREEGFEVKIANAREEKIRDISEYDLVVVGSGMQLGKWVGEAEDFLRRFQREFEGKKLAIFVSTMKMVSEREGKTEDVAEMRRVSLEDKVAKYGLKPVALGFFGGVIDFNKMGFVARRGMGFLKPVLEKDGFKEVQPGVYDLRDWVEIRDWAWQLAKIAQQ